MASLMAARLGSGGRRAAANAPTSPAARKPGWARDCWTGCGWKGQGSPRWASQVGLLAAPRSRPARRRSVTLRAGADGRAPASRWGGSAQLEGQPERDKWTSPPRRWTVAQRRGAAHGGAALRSAGGAVRPRSSRRRWRPTRRDPFWRVQSSAPPKRQDARAGPPDWAHPAGDHARAETDHPRPGAEADGTGGAHL